MQIAVRIDPFRDLINGGAYFLLHFAILRSPGRGRVQVALSPSTDGVCLSIEDEGKHIPQASLAVLFGIAGSDSLYQESVPVEYWSLLVAQQMIGAAGGTLTAGNVSPRGCRFHVRLRSDSG